MDVINVNTPALKIAQIAKKEFAQNVNQGINQSFHIVTPSANMSFNTLKLNRVNIKIVKLSV